MVRAKEALTTIQASINLKSILFLGDGETAGASVNGLPHHLQNFQSLSFSFPHLGQYMGSPPDLFRICNRVDYT